MEGPHRMCREQGSFPKCQQAYYLFKKRDNLSDFSLWEKIHFLRSISEGRDCPSTTAWRSWSDEEIVLFPICLDKNKSWRINRSVEELPTIFTDSFKILNSSSQLWKDENILLKQQFLVQPIGLTVAHLSAVQSTWVRIQVLQFFFFANSFRDIK